MVTRKKEFELATMTRLVVVLAACLGACGAWTLPGAESWTRWRDPFHGAVPQLDGDDYTSDNPFSERPCSADASRGLDLPCTCSNGPDNGTHVNCDRIVFSGDFPVLPHRYRVHGYSQRLTGYQAFPAQLFTASDVPLKRLDLSHNSVVLITEKLLDGIGDTLEDVNLSRNLLGDQLNPIFSTSEFHNLKQLKKLDLSDNDLKALDEGLFKGCDRLQVPLLSSPIKRLAT